jgi:hypothetical protein
LSNFIRTPSSNAFQVGSGTKRIIFDFPTYSSLNPSGVSSLVSDSFASTISSGPPISNREILIRSTLGTTYLYKNNAYYYVPSMEAYNCWGFNGTLDTPLYSLADNSYIGGIGSPPSLSCLVNTDASTTYTLNDSNKVLIPNSYGVAAPVLNADLLAIANKLPSRSGQLGRLIKSAGPTIWYVEGGQKKSIPSMSDLSLLGSNINDVDIVNNGASAYIPSSGVKIGNGQVVKSNESGTVYVVTSAGGRTALASGDDFLGYGYSWNNIESFPASVIDQWYPVANSAISKYLYDQASDSVYLMDRYNCYKLNSSQLTSYGQSQTSIQSGQPYSSTLFPGVSLSTCKSGSVYVKAPGQDTVYWIDAGSKHPFTTWNSFQAKTQQSNPAPSPLSQTTLDTLPVGSSL